MKRLSLLSSGLFPETLPPCFTAKDATRAFAGLIRNLDGRKHRKRSTEFTRYSGTKHDGSRRFFGTPNIISYFHVSYFISKNWRTFEKQYSKSPYSIGKPELLNDQSDRAVKVPSLSELSAHASKNIGHAPFVLKTDIAQFFPSIYTHSIPWAAHGKEIAKADTNANSSSVTFNLLDFHIRNCQAAQTRGVLVGPDAFRLVAEFVSSEIDSQLHDRVSERIVGAVRHVDDFYIGLYSESDALVVLSELRDILASFELQINDTKTKIYSSLEPINDLWAQRVRKIFRQLHHFSRREEFELSLDEAIYASKETRSDSPIKMALRRLDEISIYRSIHWDFVEKYLQRITYAHPHAIDYVCLLVAKRSAIEEKIDIVGWESVLKKGLERHIAFNNHHEVVWMLWLLLVTKINVSDECVKNLLKMNNAHVGAMLAQAYTDSFINRKPKLGLSSRLASDKADWLLNLVCRASGFSGASFGGEMSSEFEHLAAKKIRLLDFKAHEKALSSLMVKAISRTRYGYDADDSDDEDSDLDDLIDSTADDADHYF